MSNAISVRRLDFGNDRELAAVYAVECAATSHVRPTWVPLGEAARIAAWRADNGWDRQLLVASDGAEMVGVAIASTARDTPDTCWVEVSVDPRAQRRGVGSRLVGAVQDCAGPSVRRFVASVYRATAVDMRLLIDDFAQPLGYSVATTETVVELDLVEAVLPPVSRPTGYPISTHVNGVPPQLRADVGALKGLVDAEAPNGELGWQPTPVTVQEYEHEMALWQQQGRTAIESVAVDERGAVVAWTCLVVADGSTEAVTAVFLQRASRVGARSVPVESEVILHRHRTTGPARTAR